MLRALRILVSTVRAATRSRADLLLEIVALRQQLEIFRRQTPRPKLRRGDRVFWIWLRRHGSRWRTALVIGKPDTVLEWHRRGYRAYWRWKSNGKPGRPRVSFLRQHIEFIRRISGDHPEWGEDRIALELKLELGVEHSTSTIRRYMVETGSPPRSSMWKQFLASHAEQIFVMDLATQILWNYATRHMLVIMALETREVVSVAITAHPTLDGVKQQIREATPWDKTPRLLIHDNDGIFGQFGTRKGAGDSSGKRYRCALDLWLHQVLGIEGIAIPYGAPNAAAHIERFVGTLKRECLNHFIFFTEAQLRRTVVEFIGYYNDARPHQGIEGSPSCGPGEGPERPDLSDDETLRLVARPILGGLHHDYRLAA
jgi:putative transposase